LEAFRAFAAAHPEQTVLLVDTYDTLKSGVPNAIKVGREMKERGQQLKGIRLDSGDLAYMAKVSRSMLDRAGLQEVQIVASNQLDEHVIKSLNEQSAPIDIFGVGTRLVTAQPDGAFDGVYKLAMAAGKPRLKLSENIDKMTLPGIKQVYRALDEQGSFLADVVALEEEGLPKRMQHPLYPEKHMGLEQLEQSPLLQKVMKNGTVTTTLPSVMHARALALNRLERLPDEYKRFQNPHVYKVGITQRLHDLQMKLRQEHCEAFSGASPG
jgi:nicotinate phosphoribosyltransferase